MKLKPCPFCGGVAATYGHASAAYIECDSCGARIGSYVGHNSRQDAIEAWNQRHNEPPQVDEVPPLDNQHSETSHQWRKLYLGLISTSINPCTNCGSRNTKLNGNSQTNTAYINCTHCDRVGQRCLGPEEAIKAWNKANPINAN